MRFFLIFISLFILRFTFLPFDVEGELNFLYHIFMGLFVGMTAILLEKQIDKFNLRRKNKQH